MPWRACTSSQLKVCALTSLLSDPPALPAASTDLLQGGHALWLPRLSAAHACSYGRVPQWSHFAALHNANHCGPLPLCAGLGNPRDALQRGQERLATAHGSQCGFCTPGFVMSMYSLLRSKPEAPTEEEIEENLAGNLW